MIDLAVFISQADHCVTSECVDFAHLSAGIWVFIEKKKTSNMNLVSNTL